MNMMRKLQLFYRYTTGSALLQKNVIDEMAKTLEVQTINHQNFNLVCIPVTGD